jgi:predicted secreted hydrolase
MDHQWGNFVSLAGAGWDWYSIQLDDNTEYMLYVIRDAQKRPVTIFGTYVAPDGTGHQLVAAELRTQALGTWKSPHTGGVYPSGWHATIASQSLTLTLEPLVRDQELVTAHSTGVAYWEGDVAVNGTRAGKPVAGGGYVELTGYASIPTASAASSFP